MKMQKLHYSSYRVFSDSGFVEYTLMSLSVLASWFLWHACGELKGDQLPVWQRVDFLLPGETQVSGDLDNRPQSPQKVLVLHAKQWGWPCPGDSCPVDISGQAHAQWQHSLQACPFPSLNTPNHCPQQPPPEKFLSGIFPVLEINHFVAKNGITTFGSNHEKYVCMCICILPNFKRDSWLEQLYTHRFWVLHVCLKSHFL